MADNTIFVTLNGTFKNEEKCRAAMETIVKDAHAANGVNSHFWFRSKDGKSLFVLEQYEHNKALSQAIRRFTTARISFFRSIEVIGISIYGNISIGNKLMFAALRPKNMDYYGGYSKHVAKTKEPGIKNFERSRILVALNAKIIDEEKCKKAMEGIIEGAYAESGTKTHFWCRSKDGKSLFVLEQYEDEEALTEHIKVDLPSRTAFFESIEVIDVSVYGNVSDQTKEIFIPLNPMYMNYYGGYSK